MTSHSASDVPDVKLPGNPFVVESPEKLSPQQIVDLFVKEYTRLETVKQRRHTFIWGSRGSGKSMMLRYLEPQCQAIAEHSYPAVFQRQDAFLAVYCPCKEGHFNRSELEIMEEQVAAVLSEHLLNITVAHNAINCLIEQFEPGFFEKAECQKMVAQATRLFDPGAIASSVREARGAENLADDPLGWFKYLLYAENQKICTFLRDKCLKRGRANYKGATSGYHDFLLPFLKLVSGLKPIVGASVYLLLDDADRLTKVQQGIVNNWIANRDQATLCVKVSAQREAYKTYFTPRGALIEQPHDFSEVDVEELYTTVKTDYFKKIKLISERRLELSEVPTRDIDKFLPASTWEEELLQQIRKETEQEWERDKRGRKADYVYRYSRPRLFQRLKAHKSDKSYAGFQNLVDLSSGIVREFLEPCYLMFDTLTAQGKTADKIESIPVEVQNKVITKYSKDVLIDRIEDIKRDLPMPGNFLPDRVRTLVESLGRVFYELLHDPASKQPPLFSFSITGQIPEDLRQVLELAVRYRFFLAPTSQGSKAGGGQDPLYILNRRLCPAFKLDPGSFSGRLPISVDLLKLACEDPKKFVKARLKEEEEPGPTLFDLRAGDDDAGDDVAGGVE
jgi:hypothetical protein